jgi:hypothetical protein
LNGTPSAYGQQDLSRDPEVNSGLFLRFVIGTRGFRRGFSLTVAHVIGIVIVNQAGFCAMLYAIHGADAFMQPRF